MYFIAKIENKILDLIDYSTGLAGSIDHKEVKERQRKINYKKD